MRSKEEEKKRRGKEALVFFLLFLSDFLVFFLLRPLYSIGVSIFEVIVVIHGHTHDIIIVHFHRLGPEQRRVLKERRGGINKTKQKQTRNRARKIIPCTQRASSAST